MNKKKLTFNQPKPRIAIFSFFAGAGFLDLGFEVEGYDTVFVNEVYKPFMDGYKYSRENLGIKKPFLGYSEEDISIFSKSETTRLKKLMTEARRDYPLVGFIGGPPCPDFSVAGKNRGKDGKHGVLSGIYVDIIIAQKPDFFLFENVKGLWRTKIHREFYDELKKRLEAAGYFLSDKLINTLEYGVPQERERIILLGFRKDKFQVKEFPWNQAGKFQIETIKNKKWPDLDKFGKRQMTQPKDIIRELAIQYWFDKNRVTTHPNAVHVFKARAALAKFQIVAEGDVSRKSFKRPHRWRYSPTAAYGNNEVHLHPYLPRRLTVAEVLAIQSLPAEYQFPATMSLSDMFKAVGNGVSFLAARAIAKTIKNFLQSTGEVNSPKPRSGNQSATQR